VPKKGTVGLEVATPARDSGWTLLSNHGKVLVCIARDPEVRVSEIAEMVGIKERAVQRILAELRNEGVITSTRDGRRNHYRVNRRRRMPWSRDNALQVGRLIDAAER
jgi:predicted transcriptional regulator